MPIDLRLDQDEIDKQHDEVMLDIFIAEAPAVLADGQAYVVAARRVARARVLRPKRLDRVAALDADGHFVVISSYMYLSVFVAWTEAIGVAA